MKDDKQISTPSTSEMKRMIVSLTNAMKSDYAQTFKTSYPDDEAVTMLKQRLYSKLNGIPIDCILDGYELCVNKNPQFMPTIPQIVDGSLYCLRVKNREQKIQQESVKQLPSPKTEISPNQVIDMLEYAKKHSKNNLEEARAAHEALIDKHYREGKIRHRKPTYYACCKCNKPGAISNSTRGEGPWYCGEHWAP